MTEQPVIQDILFPRDPGCLSTARIQNETRCAIKYDRTLQAPALIMKGGLSHARVEIPCEGYQLPSRKFPQSIVILQIYLGSFDAFALGVTMRINASLRVELTIGTQFNKATVEDVNDKVINSKMPLIIPRNRWVQVLFHVSGILTHFLDLSPIESIECISLSGTCKASRLMVCNDEDEAINATPGDMAVFAVPAYAPPIWQTAAVIPTPACTTASKTSSGSNSMVTNPATSNSIARLPVVGETTNERRNTPTVRQDVASKSNVPSPPLLERSLARLEIVTSNPPLSPREELPEKRGSRIQRSFVSAASPSLSPLPASQSFSSSSPPQMQQKQEQQAKSLSARGSASYIRLVNPTTRLPQRNVNGYTRTRSNGLATKDSPASVSLSPVPASAVASAAPISTVLADAWCGITGWEEAIDLMNGVNVANSSTAEYPGKALSQPNPAALNDRRTSGVKNRINNNNTSETQAPKTQSSKKAMEVRKRPVVTSSRRRKGGGGGESLVDSDTGSNAIHSAKHRGMILRRSRLRKRIKLLRDAQVSARRMHEMKRLPASQLPIDPLEEAQMMTNDEIVDVMKEPRCGYGFGYLGVLREGGSFETDEGANTKLKGALTLDLPEMSEEEEEEEGENENEDEEG